MQEVSGCWWEARRCDLVAAALLRIRAALSLDFYNPITDLLREVESTSRLLRDLYDLFPVYKSSVPTLIYYLNVLLPCLCKTLRDMMIYIDNDALPPLTQWALVNERLAEQGGMSLTERFVMYIEFLVQLVRLLSRYDLKSISLVHKIDCRFLLTWIDLFFMIKLPWSYCD
jgi:hypothetical protein